MDKRIRIGKRYVGEGEKTFVVAEVSANHLQDYGRAEAIIKAAAQAGADAVLAASLFHYKELEIRQVKEYLRERGVSVRL